MNEALARNLKDKLLFPDILKKSVSRTFISFGAIVNLSRAING